MNERPRIILLHYSVPPVVGGVEAVILAQARTFIQANYPVTLVAGRGNAEALPPGCHLELIPEIDSRHPAVSQANQALTLGNLPQAYSDLVEHIQQTLKRIATPHDVWIMHNVLTKHFNLALTQALFQLIEEGTIQHAIAWCHDFSWSSLHSRSQLHPGLPWDLLRTYHHEVVYVTISEERRKILADLLGCDIEQIYCIYNGVDPSTLLGLSKEGTSLIERLGLLASDLILLMPVRVTQAKNIEYALQVIDALGQGCQNPRLVLTGPPDPHDPESILYYQALKAQRSALEADEKMRFVFESSPAADEGYTISERMVGELYRTSDIVFLPSHREGFGMPVLEAGLAGIPVFTTAIPASIEIGRCDVAIFNTSDPPEQTAYRILDLADHNPISRLRRRVRRYHTWQAIFQQQVEPLLKKIVSKNSR